MKLSPAEYAIYVFGGVTSLANAIGRSKGAVSKWKADKESPSRGCGGSIPGEAQKLILTAAKKRRLDLDPQDLIMGRSIPKRMLNL